MSSTIGIQALNDLSGPQRAALVQTVERLGALKHNLGLRLSEACLGAPVLEAAVAMSAMAQDELGHSRVLSGLARGLDDVTAGDARRQEGADAGVPEPLSRSGADWLDTLAACLVADAAARLVLEGALSCRFTPLRNRVDKMLQEEAFHRMYAEGWAESCRRSPAAGAALAGRLRVWLPAVAGWLAGLEAWAAPLADVGFRIPAAGALRATVGDSVPGLAIDAA